MSRHERHSDGIYYQHSSKCNGRKSDGSCRCNPSYQASVWIARNNKRLKKVFPTVSQAKSWRAELTTASKQGGALPAASRLTVAQALDEYIDGMKSGAILNRSHRPYKPSVIRGYARSAERIKAELGGVRITDLSRRDIKSFAAKLAADGFGPSSVRNHIDPIRVICRKAFDDEILTHDPTAKLRLPPSNARRERTVTPAEAEALIEALSPFNRPFGRWLFTSVCGGVSFRSCAGRIWNWIAESADARARGMTKASAWSRPRPRPASECSRSSNESGSG